jgi:hypothetical protein
MTNNTRIILIMNRTGPAASRERRRWKTHWTRSRGSWKLTTMARCMARNGVGALVRRGRRVSTRSKDEGTSSATSSCCATSVCRVASRRGRTADLRPLRGDLALHPVSLRVRRSVCKDSLPRLRTRKQKQIGSLTNCLPPMRRKSGSRPLLRRPIQSHWKLCARC